MSDLAERIFADEESLGAALALDALRLIHQARLDGGPFLLGCPGGRSLRSTYRWLGRHAAERGADLSHVHIVMMDEYVVRNGNAFKACPGDAHFSCRRFAFEEIRNVLNTGLMKTRQIALEHVWLPNVRNPSEYDRRIEAAGGIDLFLLASGASDGHVAFNPPGSAADSHTRIVALPESTRRDNLATFPRFNNLDEVPLHGVTVGLGTISEQSRRVALVMHGEGKRFAARRLKECESFNPDWPASIVHRCSQAEILLDHAATGGAFHHSTKVTACPDP